MKIHAPTFSHARRGAVRILPPLSPRGRGGPEADSFCERACQTPPEAAVKPTDIRVEDVTFAFEDFRYRSPIKFGGVALDRVTVLDVSCVVRTRAGKTARGRGSMPLGNVWSFPSRRLSYDDTLG